MLGNDERYSRAEGFSLQWCDDAGNFRGTCLSKLLKAPRRQGLLDVQDVAVTAR